MEQRRCTRPTSVSNRYSVVVDPKAANGYEFRGGVRNALGCRDPEVVLGGPADSGKTVMSCAKVHLVCLKYPEAQCAIVRKTYASMPGSVLQSFARIIKGAGVHTYGGDKPTKYVYPNGSTVWVGGMDNPDRVLSSERDFVYVNQTEELKVNDWETLSTRVTGRGAVVRSPQLFGDCNPGGSRHWIKERAKAGSLTLLHATHRDNPTIYHADGTLVRRGEVIGGMTMVKSGEERLAVLSKLTGVRRKRLFEGIWATAEGAVYDSFDAEQVHKCVRDWREMRTWYLAMDEGYTNPAVILLVGEDGDGRWHVFREFYQSGVLQPNVVALALAWYYYPTLAANGYRDDDLVAAAKQHHRHGVGSPFHGLTRCETVAVDESAAGLIADLVNAGVYARGGKGRVIDGITKIQGRLDVAGDGRPRLTFDPSCVNCVNDFESYVWAPDKPKDTPVKENDHSSDALRYLEDVKGEPTGAIASAQGIATGDRGGEDTDTPMERLALEDMG